MQGVSSPPAGIGGALAEREGECIACEPYLSVQIHRCSIVPNCGEPPLGARRRRVVPVHEREVVSNWYRDPEHARDCLLHTGHDFAVGRPLERFRGRGCEEGEYDLAAVHPIRTLARFKRERRDHRLACVHQHAIAAFDLLGPRKSAKISERSRDCAGIRSCKQGPLRVSGVRP